MSDGQREHTLLIVDDELEIRESLRRLLRSESYRILTASDAGQALEMLAQHAVDVLVSDIDMPGMNGLELVSQVRQRFPEVVRILLTGDASLASALDAINRGEVHRYLTKPWNKAALRETIRGAIDRLEEFRRQGDVERLSAQQRRLFGELERAYPGIGRVEYDGDVYVVDQERLERLVERLPDSVARAAFVVTSVAPTVDATPTAVETPAREGSAPRAPAGAMPAVHEEKP